MVCAIGVFRNVANPYAVVTLFAAIVQTFTQTFRIWLRFCADIWTKNWQLRPLVTVSFWMDGCMRTSVRGSDPSNDFSFETISWARGKKYESSAYLIVYSSWQWIRKLRFIKTVQDTAGLICMFSLQSKLLIIVSVLWRNWFGRTTGRDIQGVFVNPFMLWY